MAEPLTIRPYTGPIDPLTGEPPVEVPAGEARITPIKEEDVPFLELESEISALRPDGMDPRKYLYRRKQLQQQYDDLQLSKVLKDRGTFDPNGKFDSSFGTFINVLDLKRSDKFSEQYRKFKEAYPQGSIAPVETKYGGVQLVARAAPDQPYRRVGSLTADVVSGIANEPALAAAAAGVGMAIAGTAWPVTAAVVGAAAGVGSLAQDRIEQARGYQDSTETEILLKAGGEAVLNMLFEPLGVLVTGAKSTEGLRVARDRAAFARLQQESGIPIFRSEAYGPLIRTIYDVTRPLSKRAERQEFRRAQDIRDRVMARADAERPTSLPPSALSNDQLNAMIRDQHLEVLRLNNLTPVGYTKQQVGVALREAEQRLDTYMREATNRLRNEASQAADQEITTFSLNNTQNLIQQMREGRFLYTRPQTQQVNGATVTTRGLQQTNTPFADPQLSRLVEDLMQLDPTVVANPRNNAFVALADLRAQAGEIMMQAEPGTLAKQEATAIWTELSNTLRNPLGGSPDFLNRWTVYNDTYHRNMVFRRATETRKALGESTDAEAIAQQYMQPNQTDTLTMLRDQLRTMGTDPTASPEQRASATEAWNRLQQGFFRVLTRDPQALMQAPDVMRNIGPEQLDLLVDPVHQQQITRAAQQMEQLQSGPIQKLLTSNRSQADRFAFLAGDKSVTRQELEDFVARIGGPGSPEAAGIRAAIFDRFVEKATIKVKSQASQKAINAKELDRLLKEAFDSGRMDVLFSDADKRTFLRWQDALEVVNKVNSLGANMSVAAEGAEMTPRGWMEATGSPLTNVVKQMVGIVGGDMLGGFLARPVPAEKLIANAENPNLKKVIHNVLRLQMNMINEMEQQSRTLQAAPDEPNTYDLTPEEVRELRTNLQNRPSGSFGEDALNWLGGAGRKALEYLPFGGGGEPAPPPVPTPGQQGALQPRQAPATMPASNMAMTMPPQAPQKPEKGIAGTRYAALFPGDTLGAMAASGGIASLRG